MNINTFEVIIIGGSYAGLSAAMALSRSLRKVLVIDAGKPCNRQTPHAHNFIAHDGDTPASIATKARQQVLAYPTITIVSDIAVIAGGNDGAFIVTTESGSEYKEKKILLATGVKDIPMAIDGFAECWGVTVLHCPYCHGYEVKGQKLGVIANGDMAFEFARFIHHWSPNLTLFTNGNASLTNEQRQQLAVKRIAVVEKEIAAITHTSGRLNSLAFTDNTAHTLDAIFARGGIAQHTDIAAQLGCETHEVGMAKGLLKVDDFSKTNIAGVFAAGDNSTPMRSLAIAIAAGNKAGAIINHELITEN